MKVELALMVKVELMVVVKVVSNYQVVNRGGVLQSLALSVCAACALSSQPGGFIIADLSWNRSLR